MFLPFPNQPTFSIDRLDSFFFFFPSTDRKYRCHMFCPRGKNGTKTILASKESTTQHHTASTAEFSRTVLSVWLERIEALAGAGREGSPGGRDRKPTALPSTTLRDSLVPRSTISRQHNSSPLVHSPQPGRNINPHPPR